MSERERLSICSVVSHSGPNGEPLACGYSPRHEGPHSWATLPTFPVSTPASSLGSETTVELLNRTRWGASRGVVTTHDVVDLGNALEKAEWENKKLYDLAVQNGVRAREAKSTVRELLSYLESAGAYDETWTSTREVVAERVIDAARTFRAEVLARPEPRLEAAQEIEDRNQ